MNKTDAQCWTMPGLVVVQEAGARPYVVGVNGPRILTEEEKLRWERFKADLRRVK